MAYTVTFKVIPFEVFDDLPQGPSDLQFRLDTFDADDMYTIVITDLDNGGTVDTIIDGDDIVGESADDLNQTATVYDSSGVAIYTDIPIYVEWSADYVNDADPTDTLTMWRFELDRDYIPPDENFRAFAVTQIPTDGATYSTTEKDMVVDGFDASETDDVVCFTRGTRIHTSQGRVSIENLNVGDQVVTLDGSKAAIRWIGTKKVNEAALSKNPNLRPVRISKGALGYGLPTRDLLVSRQHRMQLSSKIAKRMFGQADVLVAAIKLTALPGIYVDCEVTEVEYFHILFDDHQVVFAEGAPSESLYTGPRALASVPKASRDEILAIFPELHTPGYVAKGALPIPNGKRQRQLIARHAKNNKPALEQFLSA